MTKITGHFDGKVVIPQDAARLKPNQQVTIEGEPSDPDFGTLDYVWRHMTDPLPDDVAQQMLRDIEEACENIEPERAMSSSDLAIDTTAAVAIMNKDAAIGRRLGTQVSLYMPVTVLGELYFGAEKSARVAENIARVQYLLNSVTLLIHDAATAREYGRINQILRSKGKPLPANDVWIAASAVQHQLPLVTRDEHFEHVGGLTLIKW